MLRDARRNEAKQRTQSEKTDLRVRWIADTDGGASKAELLWRKEEQQRAAEEEQEAELKPSTAPEGETHRVPAQTPGSQ
jgi:hypothetical protein